MRFFQGTTLIMISHNIAPVSVIVPCWRAGATIRRAMDSIIGQTVRPAEVLLVDDASGDGTLDVLYELANEYPTGWVRVHSLEHNSGPGGARNAGWDLATQPWVAFLDADDAWHPKKIELQHGWLQSHPDAGLCGHQTSLAFIEGVFPEIPETPNHWRVSFLSMVISNRFPTRSVMLRRDLPFRFGGKDITEDYLLWLELVLAGVSSYRIEAPLAVSFREDYSPGGYSGQLWRHEKRELAAWRVLHKKGSISSATWMTATAWSLVKYFRRILL